VSGGAGARSPGARRRRGNDGAPREKIRIDQRLVDLGLESTKARAQARIQAGEVRVAGQVVDKPGALVASDAVPELVARSPYVSRGGEKLAGALDALGVDPRGLRCLDAGASTGGFTDCLLQRGAARVLALDVGYGQLASKLRGDPRVRVVERSNVRHFELPADEPPFDLVLADLSFISLALVLGRLASFARPGGRLLLLVKPQFEVGKGRVGKGGVVRDDVLRAETVASVAAAARALGLAVRGEAESVLAGPKGNREVFLLLEKPAA
jgi:23S rRNA (cytidine1920-2'-O)/16S rRNA (cytidine1409-2'-O)-methyltransferase